MLVKHVVDLYENDKSFDEILNWIEENKLRIAHRFTVDDLNWLKRGGRVSNASALVGTLLSIKPVLYVPDAGTLDVVAKIRGRKNALNSIIDAIKKDVPAGEKIEFNINHADCLKDAEYVRDELLKTYPEAEIWCATLPEGREVDPMDQFFFNVDGRISGEVYSNIIRRLAEEKGVNVADLAAYGTYETIDGVHPNRQGMKDLAAMWMKDL